MSTFRKPALNPKSAKLAAARKANFADKIPTPVEVPTLPEMGDEMKSFLSRAASETAGIVAQITPPEEIVKKSPPPPPVIAQGPPDSRTWATRMAGDQVGGAYSMNLWNPSGIYDNESNSAIQAFHNARDPGEAVYSFNSNLWCASLLPQLTGAVLCKDECAGGGAAGTCWRSRFGGVAITRRHVVYCRHAHAWARDTWPVFPSGCIADTRLRFIDQNGVTVDRVQIHQAEAVDADICVAVLDADLPLSIYVPRIAVMSNLEMQLWQDFALSQEWAPDAGPLQPSFAASDYPLHNRNMLHVGGAVYSLPGDHPMRRFIYNVWPGDSGTPRWIVANGELLTIGLTGASNLNAPISGVPIDTYLNALCAQADANAIALGRMVSPTGYTVNITTP